MIWSSNCTGVVRAGQKNTFIIIPEFAKVVLGSHLAVCRGVYVSLHLEMLMLKCH